MLNITVLTTLFSNINLNKDNLNNLKFRISAIKNYTNITQQKKCNFTYKSYYMLKLMHSNNYLYFIVYCTYIFNIIFLPSYIVEEIRINTFF